MFEIFTIIFTIFFLTAEVSNEESNPISRSDLRFKREDPLRPIGRVAQPSDEGDGSTDDFLFGMVGSKKRRSPSKSSKKGSRKRYSRIRDEDEETSVEDMKKDVADLREDIEALKSVLRNEEDKLDELEDAVGQKDGRYWPYYYL